MTSERIAVAGLGLLGRGIAACFLGHGYHVVGVERGERELAEARRTIEQMIGELISLGGFDPKLRDEWAARFTPTTDYRDVGGCAFVVESVTEDAAIKEQVFDAIEAAVSAEAVIGSNTSAISISQLQAKRRHPERFVGMHWCQPAHATRFLELIRGKQTSPATLERIRDLGLRIGKDPCICQKDVPAFIINRIGYAMYREALNLLESGIADAETIDNAFRNTLGLWASICGPLRWIDISGGPELYAKTMNYVLPTLSNASKVAPLMQKLADEGARGSANGRGFYQYTPEEARQWDELFTSHAWRVGRMQNEYFPQEKRTHAIQPSKSQATPE